MTRISVSKPYQRCCVTSCKVMTPMVLLPWAYLVGRIKSGYMPAENPHYCKPHVKICTCGIIVRTAPTLPPAWLHYKSGRLRAHPQVCSPLYYGSRENPSSGSRNLIVCIDGTSNKFGKKNTNIIQLYSQIIKTDGQGTYYNSGIGTYARPSWRSLSYLRQLITNKIDLAIAWNVEKVIQAAYRWLADEYSPGDQIYLFGFSRGAYQVRALAGMIEHVGLLYPGNAEQIPFAYELYASVDSANGESLELAKTFKDAFSRTDVRVHFVGVWDTVSSVGFIRGKTLPSTTSSSDHICYFRHALALDERRVKFLPEYVYGGRADESNTGHVKEVWFAGSHSDVGGGNRLNEKLQLDTIPLQWMRSEAITAGLRLHPAEITWTLGDLEQGTSNSLTLGWWLLELIPFKRLLYYNSQRHTYR
ncbi:hypothetical protein BV22DRAFT_526627 [Leucogyrophana mollusca]|uniref:Uncharacterized protein n=1 Tax=Leucogyrophana mollusca TaxID=85980 RepID=A0ACB8BED2_9AGAM|nr:hypothetical protein BV22DRAFT_526627 [Leucogyrophana mollusca]